MLSFDQATKTGWALMNDCQLISYGVKDFSEVKDFTERISKIKKWMETLIKKLNPEVFSIEDIQQQVNPNVFKKLAELKGVLENLLFDKNYIYFIVSPTQWRSTCNIKGRERKEQKKNTQEFVKMKFGIDVSEDEADAIAQCYHVSIKLVPTLIGEGTE